MTEEERRIISAFVERISGNAAVPQAPSGPWGAAPAPQRPNLPPVDPEADRFIADLFARYPEARYRITQSAFVQEAALVEATNRIQQLEWEVENARRQGQAQAAQAGGGGMFGGLFGGRSNAQMPPPPACATCASPWRRAFSTSHSSRWMRLFASTSAASCTKAAWVMR